MILLINVKYIVRYFYKIFRLYLTNEKVRNIAFYINKREKIRVRDKYILFESYHGSNFTGNIYSIFNSMVKKDLDFKYFIVLKDLNNPIRRKIEKEHKRNVEFVKYESYKYFKLLSKSKYLINDTSFMSYFIKRDSQIYVNTWHGTPIKKLGKDIESNFLNNHKNIQRNIAAADKLIFPNKFTSDTFVNSLDLNGILNADIGIYGNARMDLTINRDRNNLQKKYKLEEDKKIVLYAPTWEENLEDGKEYALKLSEEVSKIQETLGEDYKVYLKTHYFLYENIRKYVNNEILIPSWFETNELLVCVDMLITDYSSIMFDYLPLNRPVYFYLPNHNQYIEKRGIYIDIKKLPGHASFDFSDLINTILIEETQYKNTYIKQRINFLQLYCYLDDGRATERAIDFILGEKNENKLYKNNKKTIVIYGGGFYNNGITKSLLNLSNNIDYNLYEVIILENERLFKDKVTNIGKLNSNVKIFYNFSKPYSSALDMFNEKMYFSRGYRSKIVDKVKIKKNFNREFKRTFGEIEVDTIIDYSAYNSFYTSLIGFSDVNNKIVFLHNDMEREFYKIIDNKYKHQSNLKISFEVLNKFHKIISVSESATSVNKKFLYPTYIDDYKKMFTLSNIIDGDNVLEKASQGHEKVYYDFVTKSNVSIEKKVTTFINLGRLSPEKNQKALIVAFNKLIQSDKNVKLYIIGEGPLLEELISCIKDLKLEYKVLLLGFIDDPFKLMNDANCVIMPSIYEGQCMVLLEARVLRKPIIATDVTGIKSIISNENGLLINTNIDDIYIGMYKFIHAQIPFKNFDFNAYNNDIIDYFNNVIIK
ncbi:glycosyltransferase [Staphylococcus equorum]|uniref:glycosyltransferase n=1 Tax=Staphylococcus equorum TaxID=246432 RepID=UPI002DB94984|nr:glycosyltransferase [Staphylococcus equorum]